MLLAELTDDATYLLIACPVAAIVAVAGVLMYRAKKRAPRQRPKQPPT